MGVRISYMALFDCPGGCVNPFQLSLNPGRRPRWTVTAAWPNRATVAPSMRQMPTELTSGSATGGLLFIFIKF